MSHVEIGPHCVGVYMAYPTSETLKPIYRKLKTVVNSAHTKIGITTQSFHAREREYQNTFQREVVFIRLAQVPADRIAEIESAILKALGIRYSRVGRAREWFKTSDRTAIQAEVLNIVAGLLAAHPAVSQALNRPSSRSTKVLSNPLPLSGLSKDCFASLGPSVMSNDRPHTLLTSKELGDEGEAHACELLRARGFTAALLRVNSKTYDIQASRGSETFMVSVKVAREKQHVRLGSRRSVLGLRPGNFVFAFIPARGGQIQTLASSPHTLLIIPAEVARDDALLVHDPYWIEKSQDPNIFSVMVKGYGSHHQTIWPRWLEYRDAWHLLTQN